MLNRLKDVFRSFQQHEVKYQEFYVVAKLDLILSKRASGRDVDLEDVRLLELPDSEDNEQKT